jgi:hypothetical protein
MSDYAQKAANAHSTIRKVLLTEWDPIGVLTIPEAQDEYDAYVSEVYRLLSRRVDINRVFDYLWWVETVHMDLVGDRQRTEKVAKILMTLISDGLMPGTIEKTGD